jgi:hypothetical protein
MMICLEAVVCLAMIRGLVGCIKKPVNNNH